MEEAMLHGKQVLFLRPNPSLPSGCTGLLINEKLIRIALPKLAPHQVWHHLSNAFDLMGEDVPNFELPKLMLDLDMTSLREPARRLSTSVLCANLSGGMLPRMNISS